MIFTHSLFSSQTLLDLLSSPHPTSSSPLYTTSLSTHNTYYTYLCTTPSTSPLKTITLLLSLGITRCYLLTLQKNLTPSDSGIIKSYITSSSKVLNNNILNFESILIFLTSELQSDPIATSKLSILISSLSLLSFYTSTSNLSSLIPTIVEGSSIRGVEATGRRSNTSQRLRIL